MFRVGEKKMSSFVVKADNLIVMPAPDVPSPLWSYDHNPLVRAALLQYLVAAQNLRDVLNRCGYPVPADTGIAANTT